MCVYVWVCVCGCVGVCVLHRNSNIQERIKLLLPGNFSAKSWYSVSPKRLEWRINTNARKA